MLLTKLTALPDITLICPASAAKATQTALDTNPFLTSLPTPKPDLLSPAELDQNTVTADILRLPEVRQIVTSDFVVLPCDLVCALAGEKLLQAWMVRAASLPDLLSDGRSPDAARSGGLGVYYDTRKEVPIKGEETDFIAITPDSDPTFSTASRSALPKDSVLSNLHNLVYSMPTDSLNDLIEEKSSLPIRHSLLRKHPRVRFMTKHRDAHIYIFPRWVMDFVASNEKLESIGEDVVGWWAKAGWQTGLADKLCLAEALRKRKAALGLAKREDRADQESPRSERDDEERNDGSASADEEAVAEDGEEDSGVRDTAAGAVESSERRMSRSSEGGSKAEQVQVPPMLAYIHPSGPTAPLIRRVDTAKLLLATSLELAKLPSLEEVNTTDPGSTSTSPFAHARKIAYPEGVSKRTTITQADSLLADNVTVSEKAGIRESVVGANCQIGEGAKLLQCLLMDGAVVGKNVKLTRCVLGRRCEIGEGSVLTDCEVQENLLVEHGSKFSPPSLSCILCHFPFLAFYSRSFGSDNAVSYVAITRGLSMARKDACIWHSRVASPQF
jgi:translation initiation factor eIF-2B subunit gamma